jgi:HAD superfamily hydrolase (TIGR01549 family)
VGVVNPAALDAVTIDAYGTLLELRDPVASLARLLPAFGRDAIDRAFRAEVDHYIAHAVEGRDADSLAKLRAECTRVFNEELGSSLSPDEFMGALEFTWIDGAVEAVERLRARGLAIGVVSNWDISLHEHLAGLGVPIATSAEAGARKPNPAVFRLALERLGVAPERALHVGDTDADEQGARAAGLAFAHAPLTALLEAWA